MGITIVSMPSVCHNEMRQCTEYILIIHKMSNTISYHYHYSFFLGDTCKISTVTVNLLFCWIVKTVKIPSLRLPVAQGWVSLEGSRQCRQRPWPQGALHTCQGPSGSFCDWLITVTFLEGFLSPHYFSLTPAWLFSLPFLTLWYISELLPVSFTAQAPWTLFLAASPASNSAGRITGTQRWLNPFTC